MYCGLWRKDNDEEMEVAVKSLGKEASEEERVMFLKEAVVMGQFNHMYIVKILGIIDDEPVSETVILSSFLVLLINFHPGEHCGGIAAKRRPSTSPYLTKT